jgi:hypothetical protein
VRRVASSLAASFKSASDAAADLLFCSREPIFLPKRLLHQYRYFVIRNQSNGIAAACLKDCAGRLATTANNKKPA